ncbi:hypothetical protein CFIMG_003183RA [Ceratocystis fimbriata CBS 114723]|uniref:Secreted protein n=1 Tax=Ceratocystis fimbriata CBS 114723 TaxID=1035309 RepID=A0A2C5XAI8_9PEZI|nr:hypothetical protein CFIMG_003183RA [Ceratocystis fimbriata CBS 114723]
MKTSALYLLFAAFNLTSASILITPVFADQVLNTRNNGDCPYGVVTPEGCAPLRKRKPSK